MQQLWIEDGPFILALWVKATLLCFLLSQISACGNSPTNEHPEGPRLLRDAGANGCPHQLMPLLPGARWTYDLDDGTVQSNLKSTGELRVLEINRNNNTLIARVKRTVGSSVTTVEALCNPEGTSFLALFIPLGPPLSVTTGYTPRVTKRNGVLIPTYESSPPTKGWTLDLIAHTERPGGRVLTMDSNWNVKGRFLGEKSITVPAGRYTTQQFEFVVGVHHRPPEEEDITFNDRIMDPPQMQFTYSLAPGVGVVLIEGELLTEGTPRRSRWSLTKVDLVGTRQ